MKYWIDWAQEKGMRGNYSETFGFLASTLARSYNTGYTAHFVRPNPFGTSYSPNTLGDILLGDFLRKNKVVFYGRLC